jgi:hypothetical protein
MCWVVVSTSVDQLTQCSVFMVAVCGSAAVVAPCALLTVLSSACCALQSGKCARGDMCPYSHGVFEQWLHPSR